MLMNKLCPVDHVLAGALHLPSTRPVFPEVPKTNALSYFLDESGDATLFDKDGRLIAGQKGKASRYLILGNLAVSNPATLTAAMETLRQELISTPSCIGTRSFIEGRLNTRDHFHATNDPNPVRRRVFELLAQQDVSYSAVLIDKLKVHK